MKKVLKLLILYYRKDISLEKMKKNALRKATSRSKESEDAYLSRLDKDAFRKAFVRANESQTARKLRLSKDAKQKAIIRSNESEMDRHCRLLDDATRHSEMRSVEKPKDHQLRISIQHKRQKSLRSSETSEQTSERQNSDASRKILKRAAKSDGFENFLNPNDAWNAKLDKDMIRKQKFRSIETEEQKTLRRKKDAEYHMRVRSEESLQDRMKRNLKKAEDRHSKREDDKQRKAEKWLEIHRQTNLKRLKEHGSYLRFLLFGAPRKSFYGCFLPSLNASSIEVEDWKWLQNNISNEEIMGSGFRMLSQKYAILFKQIGLSRNDVVHLVVESRNYIFGVLGGIWLIGGIISLSDVSRMKQLLRNR